MALPKAFICADVEKLNRAIVLQAWLDVAPQVDCLDAAIKATQREIDKLLPAYEELVFEEDDVAFVQLTAAGGKLGLEVYHDGMIIPTVIPFVAA